MKTQLESLFAAFAMYSRIPVPHTDWNEKNLRYCLCYFPLIGAVIGLAAAAWQRLAVMAGWGVLFRTAVLILLPVVITGGIHVDGLLDTADALGSWQPMERRLEIMKDPHTGAFAVIAGIGYFILLGGIMTEADSHEVMLIGLGYILSRAWSGLGVIILKKAKGSGLLRTFSDGANFRGTIVCLAVCLVLVSAALIWLDPVKGILIILASAAVFIWYRHISYHWFGGITGDLAGCFLQVCELAVAAVAALI